MMKRDDWQDVIETNIGGVYNFTKAVIFGFMKQRSGKIVNISSISGLVGVSGQTNYSTTKAGIIGFTKSLAKETAKYGINVNAVAPGFIQTDMFTSLSDKIKEDLIQNIPLGRIGLPEEVAKIVKFLLSNDANYITGQVIIIDGGMTV